MLFEPFESPRLSLRNRLVVPPMATFSSLEDGSVNPEEIAFLGRRAAGGFGLIVTGACYVIKHGQAFTGQWGCDKDERIAGLEAMAKAIHDGGAKAYLQIHHGGRHCPRALCECRPLCASEVPPAKEGAEAPAAMTEAQIWETIRAFAEATGRAKQAGFDGVEIHGANGYLLQQFMSPATNRRDDGWGRNRMAFPLAVVDAALGVADRDFGVGYRLSPDEAETPGLRLADTHALVEELCHRPLAYIHLSTQDHKQIGVDAKEAALSAVAGFVANRVPLIGVGGVKAVPDALEVLAMGADLVAIGRAAITEPEWPMRAPFGGDLRLKFPREGAVEKLTIPKDLAAKMLAVPGWADVEE